MTFSFLTILFLILAVVTAAAIILSGWFTHIILYPRVVSLSECFLKETQKGWMSTSSFASLKKEDFTISSEFGYLIHGELISNHGAAKTIILSHGISSNRYGMLRYIPLFLEMGYNVLIYDMRGHGASSGNSVTYGVYEKQDLKSLVDWLLQKYGSGMSIGTMGISLGAAVSIQHASIDPRVTFTIAEASFSDFPTLLAYRLKEEYHLPPFPLISLTELSCSLFGKINLDNISPVKACSTIRTPVFLIHGQADTYIPPEMSRAIFDALTTTHKGIYFSPGAGHSGSLRADPEEYKRQVVNFLTAIESF